MEEIKIKYSKNIDIELNLIKIINGLIKNDNFEYKIIFVDDLGNNIKDYEELQSYKLLIENIDNLSEKIKKEKGEFKKLKDEIEKMYKE